jgi:hypothetical protein
VKAYINRYFKRSEFITDKVATDWNSIGIIFIFALLLPLKVNWNESLTDLPFPVCKKLGENINNRNYY